MPLTRRQFVSTLAAGAAAVAIAPLEAVLPAVADAPPLVPPVTRYITDLTFRAFGAEPARVVLWLTSPTQRIALFTTVVRDETQTNIPICLPPGSDLSMEVVQGEAEIRCLVHTRKGFPNLSWMGAFDAAWVEM